MTPAGFKIGLGAIFVLGMQRSGAHCLAGTPGDWVYEIRDSATAIA